MSEEKKGVERMKLKTLSEKIKKIMSYEFSRTMGGNKTDYILISKDDFKKIIGKELSE